MKGLCLFVVSTLIIPVVANATETSILYHQKKISGPQVSKYYYVKESIKKVDPKNPKLIQVKTHTTVKSPEGTTTYRVTDQINCETKQFTIVKYWSSGYGDDNGTMVDGKWRAVTDYDDATVLAKKICPKK
jgi:Cu/Ag efflux protein CusF